MSNPFIVVFGGSFNPFHIGHLRMIEGCLDELDPEKLLLIPNARSPFKNKPTISNQHRMDMLVTIANHFSHVEASDIELHRGGASYAIDTLKALALTHQKPLVFLLGSDSFAEIEAWHMAEGLHQYCHFALVEREGSSAPQQAAIAKKLSLKITHEIQDLSAHKSGYVYLSQVKPPHVSATYIRKHLDESLLPEAIKEYLKEHKLSLKDF